MIYYDICSTPIGWCGVVASRSAIQRIFLAEEKKEILLEAICRQFPGSCADADVCREAGEFLARYFLEGAALRLPENLDFGPATAFQRRVWDVTVTIPFGQVRTYGWLAARLGYPGAARAVGSALGRNPLPLLVPCHRIVCSSGHPGGFSATGGSKLKRLLLEHEGVVFDSQGKVII